MCRSEILLLVGALGGAVAGPALAATAPATGLQQSVSLPACNGKTACVFTFGKVAAGKTLTVTHVSCTIVTGGLSGGVDHIFLYSSQFGLAQAYDTLLSSPLVLDSANVQAIANTATTFFVAAGFSPVIDVTTSVPIKSGPGAAAASCFISGYES